MSSLPTLCVSVSNLWASILAHEQLGWRGGSTGTFVLNELEQFSEQICQFGNGFFYPAEELFLK